MNLGANLATMQAAIREAGHDGWLFYDHHHRDPIGERILGLDPKAHITRRWYYFIPATGEPRKLVHSVEAGRLDSLPGSRASYSSWQELHERLAAMLSGFQVAVISEPEPAPAARELFPDELAAMPRFLCFLFFVLQAG